MSDEPRYIPAAWELLHVLPPWYEYNERSMRNGAWAAVPVDQHIACKRNGHGPEVFARYVQRNGNTQIVKVCGFCGHRAGEKMFYPKVRVRDWENLPLWADKRWETEEHPYPQCERCGSTDGTERHHWAPWHLFDDAHEWPTSYLCRPCHMLWHRVTKTGSWRQREAS